MSQLGMQMPAAAGARKSTLNVYTGLALFAFASLLAAVAIMWQAGTKLGPSDQGPMAPIKLQQEGNVKLAD